MFVYTGVTSTFCWDEHKPGRTGVCMFVKCSTCGSLLCRRRHPWTLFVCLFEWVDFCVQAPHGEDRSSVFLFGFNVPAASVILYSDFFFSFLTPQFKRLVWFLSGFSSTSLTRYWSRKLWVKTLYVNHYYPNIPGYTFERSVVYSVSFCLLNYIKSQWSSRSAFIDSNLGSFFSQRLVFLKQWWERC